MNEVQKTDDKALIEYVPFGAQDKIKLSIAIIKNLIAVKTKSGKTCSDQDAVKFIALCQARRLSPFEGDCFLIGYDGRDGAQFSLITAHQAFLKRAELNPEYDGMKSGIIVERNGEMMDLEGDFYLSGDKVLGGWATVFFKNRKQPMHKRVRIERFKKPFGIWLDDAAGMICKCAEADALRSSFPTMLGGLYLNEEVTAVDDKKQTTSPIFSEPAKDKPLEAEVVPEHQSTDRNALVSGIRNSLKTGEVKEKQLMDFLIGIGTIETGKSLDDVADATIIMVHEQIGEIINRIKESK